MDALRYGFAGGLVGGALAGLGQWLFLRLWAGGDADGWGTATPLLWAVTWALAFALLDLDEDTSALRWVLSGLLVLSLGAVIGAGQWFVLRRIAPRAGWWVIACASSALLTMVVMAHTRSGWALVTGGIALGGGTGAALLWLLPERQAVAETG